MEQINLMVLVMEKLRQSLRWLLRRQVYIIQEPGNQYLLPAHRAPRHLRVSRHTRLHTISARTSTLAPRKMEHIPSAWRKTCSRESNRSTDANLHSWSRRHCTRAFLSTQHPSNARTHKRHETPAYREHISNIELKIKKLTQRGEFWVKPLERS